MVEKKRIRNKSTGRDYKTEYRNYQGKPDQIKKRAKRNAARAKMERAGKVRKGDGKDVDHRNGVNAGNGDGNLRVQSKSNNRSFPRDKNAKKRRGGGY